MATSSVVSKPCPECGFEKRHFKYCINNPNAPKVCNVCFAENGKHTEIAKWGKFYLCPNTPGYCLKCHETNYNHYVYRNGKTCINTPGRCNNCGGEPGKHRVHSSGKAYKCHPDKCSICFFVTGRGHNRKIGNICPKNEDYCKCGGLKFRHNKSCIIGFQERFDLICDQNISDKEEQCRIINIIRQTVITTLEHGYVGDSSVTISSRNWIFKKCVEMVSDKKYLTDKKREEEDIKSRKNAKDLFIAGYLPGVNFLPQNICSIIGEFY